MERPWDIIDEIQGSVGKIRSAKYARPGTKGYYGEYYRDALRGPGGVLFSPTGQAPDEVVDSLRESGSLGRDASVDDLWDAIRAAAEARRAIARRQSPEAQAERFTKALAKRSRGRCKRLVPVQSLAIGDKLRFDRETMTVEDVDPDTSEVILQDGKRFGRQAIPDGEFLPVDAVCERKPKKPLGPVRISKKAVKRLSGLIAARRAKLVHRKRKPLKRKANSTKRLAQKPKRKRPAVKRGPKLIAVRQGRFVKVLRLLGSKVKAVGTFSQNGLRRWAARNNIRLK